MLAVPRARVHADVVAVVLNWNGWRDTIECLESLLHSASVPSRVVVCDNGSIDGSLRRIEEWAAGRTIAYTTFASPADAFSACAGDASATPLVLIQNGENGGFAAGNNVGIRYAIDRAGAAFVWILNNDVVVGAHALDRMLEAARANANVGIVGATLLRYDSPHTVQALGGGFILPVICHDTQLGSGRTLGEFFDDEIALDHLIGANLLVRAQAVRDVGLMDETYFLYREETDWCIAMRRRGWELVCRTDAAVWHKQSRSIGFKSPMHDYYAVRNMLRLVRKFYPASLPSAFGYYAVRSVLPKLARFEFARLGAVMRAFGDFLRGVDGRPSHHTDAKVMRQYVPEVKLAAVEPDISGLTTARRPSDRLADTQAGV